MAATSAAYHGFFDIPLIRGRDIAEHDTRASPRVVVINETLARQAFPGTDPLGRFINVPLFGEPIRYEVVGIAADRRNAGLRAPPEPEIVMSLHQWEAPAMTLIVDWPGAPARWARMLEEKLWEINPVQPVSRSFSLEEDLEAQLRPLRFFATATSWFAVLALILSAVGMNAVIAAMQRRRTREIGLRMALGASPRDAGVLVFGAAARILAVGLVMGFGLAVPVSSMLRYRLFEAEGVVPWLLFAVSAFVLGALGLAAASWPIWRASRIEPMEALRTD